MQLESPSYLSWGRVARYEHQVLRPNWPSDIHFPYPDDSEPVLAYGYGRSYGDSCLNGGGLLVDTKGLRRMLSFDGTSGLLACESGVSLAEIIEVFLPRGWFPAVVPGTKFVSVGGAIANDIHGKNHHRAGCFGNHVKSFKLLRSNGEIKNCSIFENPELFAATIGGLGLTGLILSVVLQLKKIESPLIDAESIRMKDLDHFFQLSRESDSDFEYTVAWIDVTAPAKFLGRGIFMRGRHHSADERSLLSNYQSKSEPIFSLPVEFPFNVVSDQFVKLFNTLYLRKLCGRKTEKLKNFEPFFFPLDFVGNWNLAYGSKGFFQHQCVIPQKYADSAIQEILEIVSKSGTGSFLSVLKNFGSISSPGMLSFPMCGSTLAMDFANQGEKTMNLLQRLDEVVSSAGGRIYPAKDGRMNRPLFHNSHPKLEQFKKHIDPKFSSSFSRRLGINIHE